MSKNYAGIEDLLSDDSFLSWYFKTDPRAIRQWDQWIADNPGSIHRVQQAVTFLQSVHLQEAALAPGQITKAEILLFEKIRQAENRLLKIAPASGSATLDNEHPGSNPFGNVLSGSEHPGSNPFGSAGSGSGSAGNNFPGSATPIRIPRRRRWMAAASIILLVAALGGGYLWSSRRPELHTAYGEVRDNRLPDGTEVTVNANSKLLYSTGWKDGKDREVWLTGEAFFHVVKTPLKSRFVVHTDHFDIIVTGTRFNVVNRNNKTNIMLKEGSVTLHTHEGRDIKMVPGDFVEYHGDRLEKKLVKDDSVLAWKEHNVFLDSTTLYEVVQIIRDHYGISVQLEDDSIGHKTVSGILSNDNLDVLLQAVAASTDLEVVHQEDGHILLRHHPSRNSRIIQD